MIKNTDNRITEARVMRFWIEGMVCARLAIIMKGIRNPTPVPSIVALKRERKNDLSSGDHRCLSLS
jgi:hypothetical protein